MTIDRTELERGVAAGGVGLEALALELETSGGAALLVEAAEHLRDMGSGDAVAWSAWLLARAGDHEGAVARYRGWLADAEAPAALHLAALARSLARLGDVAGTYRAVAALHPWDLSVGPREIAARALDEVGRGDGGPPEGFAPLRMAVLSTSSASTLLPMLRVAALRHGLALDLYEGGYDALRREIADPDSGLYRHRPEVVLLATGWRDLEPGRGAEEQADDWAALWRTLLDRTEAHVLQHTFDLPPGQPLGHLDLRRAGGRTALAQQLNLLLAERAPDRVSLVDYAGAVARYGADRWCDPERWYWAKEAVAPEAGPVWAEEVVAVLAAVKGRARKVLVLDLDNTVWGGIVGEVGPGGLELGPPSLRGEAYVGFQRYCKALKERGVLLAACSKNDPEDARAPFEQLDDMVLSLDDFVAFHASWDPKPDRIRAMARELNLGLDAFVFVDDNPAERALVRRELPEVLTIPVERVPLDLEPALHRSRAFEVLDISDEDRARTEMYTADAQRRELEATTDSLDGFWASLQMVATLRPFRPADRTRIVQLAGRSNQFNLTTWRMTAADVQRVATSATHRTLTVRLADRFGDHGLVLILVTEVRQGVLHVDQWCMSCRVIGRGMEQLVSHELDRMAAELGCEAIEGRRIPTKKNRLVAELYVSLGFEHVSGDGVEETAVYRRPVGRPGAAPVLRIERLPVEEADWSAAVDEVSSDEAAPVEVSSGFAARLAGLEPAARVAMVSAAVRREVAALLQLDGPDAVPVDRPMSELGLDSLMVIALRRALSERVGVLLPADAFTEHATVAVVLGLVGRALGLEAVAPEAEAPAPIAAGRAPSVHLERALGGGERSMWLMDRALAFNQLLVLDVEGELHEDELREALRHAQRRHPMLQVQVATRRKLWPELRYVPGELPLAVRDVEDHELQGILEADLNRRVDLHTSYAGRVTWLRRGPERSTLSFVSNHALTDGMALAYWVRDTLEALRRIRAGEDPRLGPLPPRPPMRELLPAWARTSERWGHFVRTFMGMVSEEEPQWLEPEDEGGFTDRRGHFVMGEVPEQVVANVVGRARREHASAHAAFCAATAAAVAERFPGGSMRIALSHPVDLRRRVIQPPLGDEVGFFQGMSVTSHSVSAHRPFWDLAREVHDRFTGDLEKGGYLVFFPELMDLSARLSPLVAWGEGGWVRFAEVVQAGGTKGIGMTNMGQLPVPDRIVAGGRQLRLAVRALTVSPSAAGELFTTFGGHGDRMLWTFGGCHPGLRRESTAAIGARAQELLSAAVR